MDDVLTTISGLPAILKIALPILLIFLVGAIVKKVIRYAVIIGLVILFILFVYPLFDY